MDEQRQILARLEVVEAFMRSLQSASNIPFEVDVALRDRLNISSDFAPSTKAVSTETRAVNEAGSSTYSVPTLMDGFISANLKDGTEIAVPYYL